MTREAENAIRRRAQSLAEEIEGTDAAAILLEMPYRSFCRGSDALERMGLLLDAEYTELAYYVIRELRLALAARSAAA